MEKWRWELQHHCPGIAWVILGNTSLNFEKHGGNEDILISAKEIAGLLMRLKEIKGRNVTYVECDARARGKLQPVVDAVSAILTSDNFQ